MNRTGRPVANRLCAALILQLVLLLPWSPAASDAGKSPASEQPSELEMNFWRSTEQIGTPDAYQAYLTKFPNGYFAQLARAALAKTQGSRSPDWPSKSTTESRSVDPSRIARTADSGAVVFSIGDVFQGPGVITVGWLGAKKQVVLPPGRWLVLAASDSYSSHARPIHMTTIVFGRFSGTKLESSLEAVFNSKPGGSLGATWTDMSRCELTDAAARVQARSTIGIVDTCIKLKPIKLNPKSGWSGAWGTVRSSLESLGAEFDPGLALSYLFVLQDTRGGFMRLSRLDYGTQTATTPLAASTPESSTTTDRRQWAQAYAGLLAKGIGKDLPFDDLPIGGATPTPALPLPD